MGQILIDDNLTTAIIRYVTVIAINQLHYATKRIHFRIPLAHMRTIFT